MARRALTPELYNRLIDAFRIAPANASYAARSAGCERRMAARGWEIGWEKQHAWAKPIRDVIKGEMESARAERFRLIEEERTRADKEREASRKDAIQASAEEARAVQIARVNSIAIGGLLQGLLKAMMPLATKVQQDLAGASLTPREIAKLIGDTAVVTRHANQAIKIALELERLRLGEPTNIIGIQGQLDDVSAEEAVEELIGIQRTLTRAVKVMGPQANGSYVDSEGNIVIDLPQEAFEEQEAEVIDLHPAPAQSRRRSRKA